MSMNRMPEAPLRGPGGQPDRGNVDSDNLSTLVELHDVDFRYASGLLALDRVSMSVERGRNVAITGPSGCGKSTLLRLVAGLTTPTAGTLRRAEPPAGQHGLSMMFQEDTLLPWLTVGGNVALHFKFEKRSKEHVRRVISDLLPLPD